MENVAFGESVGEGTVRFCSAVGAGMSSVGASVVLLVTVIDGCGVVAFVGAAVVLAAVVEGRGVAVRTVGDVADREVCVAAFETAVEVISADTPATVGRVDCATASEEEALTVWDAPHVAAGVAA
ncbi:MAG TPA: hypothetical protein HA263_04150 [Methanoregulaceae archaeon]|nr:hypothetical protein [Methanoregulaceae archaeon]